MHAVNAPKGDVSAWIDIDLSGIETLNEIHAELIQHETQLAFANCKGYIRQRLTNTKFVGDFGGMVMMMMMMMMRMMMMMMMDDDG